MTFRTLLTMQGTLQRGTVSRGLTGAEVIAWADHSVGVPCLLRPRGSLVEMKPGVERAGSHVVYSEIIADLLAAPTDPWRWLIGAETFRVTEPRDPGGRGHHLETLVARV